MQGFFEILSSVFSCKMSESKEEIIDQLIKVGWTRKECVSAYISVNAYSFSPPNINDILDKLISNQYIISSPSAFSHYCNIHLLTFGYIRETYEHNESDFVPPEIKLLCCDYRGYSLCCIAIGKWNDGSTMVSRDKFKSDETLFQMAKDHDRFTLRSTKVKKLNTARALFTSIIANHVKCYQFMFQRRIWNTLRIIINKNNYHPIHVASLLNNIEIMNISLTHKANVNIRDM